MKYYCGMKSVDKWEVFRCNESPTYATHGRHYLAVIGPFRTKRGAQFMADYGYNNPHLQTVTDAEIVAKYEEAK